MEIRPPSRHEPTLALAPRDSLEGKHAVLEGRPPHAAQGSRTDRIAVSGKLHALILSANGAADPARRAHMSELTSVLREGTFNSAARAAASAECMLGI